MKFKEFWALVLLFIPVYAHAQLGLVLSRRTCGRLDHTQEHERIPG